MRDAVVMAAVAGVVGFIAYKLLAPKQYQAGALWSDPNTQKMPWFQSNSPDRILQPGEPGTYYI